MTTLLAIGDLHLGRPPAAVPESLRADAEDFGPAAAWTRCVEDALQRRVDAVLMAGDLVDQERDFFVGYDQLKRGIERLLEAGIPVLAVAGNHDTRVLPRLADEISGLELLGAGGEWQSRRVADLTVLGWSFPRPQVRMSPVDRLPDPPGQGVVVGLLHCDLDRSDSPHAPVARRALERAPVDAWLLGHIHRPDQLDTDRPLGYLGSATALRASETGDRGPWLVHIEGRDFAADHLPLAPLRYETLEIDCSEIDDAGALADHVLASARERARMLAGAAYTPRALGFRITLTGRSTAALALESAGEEIEADGRAWEESGIACFVQKVSSTVLPAIDLERLARQSDPCGLLARRLLALEDPESQEYGRLIRLGRKSMAPILEAREFIELDADPDDADVAAWMIRAGRAALSRLVAQRETAE